MPHRFLIFTDLDGTLLDHDTYSFDRALPALRLLDKENIPLVINTSKSRAEIERCRSLLGNRHPFVSENGGGIFIPEGYFSRKFRYDRASDGYLVIEPGTPREELIDVLKSVADETGIRLRGISDMSLSEIMEATGLDEESARLAMERSYSEPFLIYGDEAAVGSKRTSASTRPAGSLVPVGVEPGVEPGVAPGVEPSVALGAGGLPD